MLMASFEKEDEVNFLIQLKRNEFPGCESLLLILKIEKNGIEFRNNNIKY